MRIFVRKYYYWGIKYDSEEAIYTKMDWHQGLPRMWEHMYKFWKVCL